MRYLSRIVVAVLALLLAACGAADTGGASQPIATSAPAPTAAAAATAAPVLTAVPAPTAAPAPTQATRPADETKPTGQPASGDVVAIYHKTGGIAGVDETLTVYADGRLSLLGRSGAAQTAQAQPADLGKLQSLLASPDFAGLSPRYQASGADLFNYQITIPSTGQTVSTMDGAQAPAVLGQAITEMEQLKGMVK